jgi:hypothetical protein
MSVGTIIQFALAFMRLANWIASRIDRAEWERSGWNQAAAEQAVEWKRNVGIADEAVKQAQATTPQQRKDILEGDL